PCKTELRSQMGSGYCVVCFLFFSLSPVSSHHFPIPLLTLWNISIIVLWSVTACAGLPHTHTHTHARARTHTHTHTHTHTYTDTHTHSHAHTHMTIGDCEELDKKVC